MKRILLPSLISSVLFLTATTPSTAQNYTISTIAGGGACVKNSFGGCATGDGGAATSAYLTNPTNLSTDASGNLYVVDSGVIRKVSPTGTISTVDLSAFGPSPGSAQAVAFDSAGNMYVGFSANFSSTLGILPVGGRATTVNVGLNTMQAIALDTSGNVYCSFQDYIYKVNPNTGTNTRVFAPSFNQFPEGLATDSSGNLFAALGLGAVIKIDPSGKVTTIAGASTGFSGDGGQAINAAVSQPWGVALDASGNLFFADSGNNRVRKIDKNGIITTIAGSGSVLYNGDGGAATSAGLNKPQGLLIGSGGQIYVADAGHGAVRLLTPGATVPSITSGGIVPVYSTVPTVQPGEWVSIYGTGLASSTVTWKGDFPTSLGGTSVTIDGKSAYLWFVSPTQINLQVPNDSNTGSVPVVVTTAAGTSTSTVTLAQFAPSFSLLDGKHVTGIILRSNGSGAYGGGVYDIIGPTGSSLGYPTVAANAGDNVELFGVGFGPTNPTVTPGQVFSGAAQTTNTVNLTINNVTVNSTFAGLSGAGLYQINLTLPANLGTGDVPLVASVGGVQTPSGVVISLQGPAVGGTPQLKSLSVSPSQVSGGKSAQGTVTLTAPALTGGVVVAVASSLANVASVPPTVTVPAGSVSAIFPISTVSVTSNQIVGIGVAYSGLTASAVLTVTP